MHVLSKVILYTLPGEISRGRNSARSKNEINPAKQYDDDNCRPDPQTSITHLQLEGSVDAEGLTVFCQLLLRSFADNGTFADLEE